MTKLIIARTTLYTRQAFMTFNQQYSAFISTRCLSIGIAIEIYTFHRLHFLRSHRNDFKLLLINWNIDNSNPGYRIKMEKKALQSRQHIVLMHHKGYGMEKTIWFFSMLLIQTLESTLNCKYYKGNVGG
jgi:hypothetical protein